MQEMMLSLNGGLRAELTAFGLSLFIQEPRTGPERERLTNRRVKSRLHFRFWQFTDSRIEAGKALQRRLALRLSAANIVHILRIECCE
jgi:hypothetical protein